MRCTLSPFGVMLPLVLSQRVSVRVCVAPGRVCVRVAADRLMNRT